MDLVEREGEIAQLARAVADVREGHGAVVLIEGPAGIGKTALLGLACSIQGVHVLKARAEPGELDFAHGVTRGLYEHVAPEALAEALRGGDRFAIRHALYWLVLELADEQPLLLVVDDVQWADGPSLEALLHLCGRIVDTSCGVILARRTGQPGAERLDELAAASDTWLITPEPLTLAGVGQMVGAQVTAEVLHRLHEITGGNPHLVREVLRELGDALDQDSLASLDSARLGRAVLLRLARLGPSAPALATALTVLGEGAPLRQAAALTDLDLNVATRTADALRAAEVLAPGVSLEFMHPVIRAAVEQAQPAGAHAAAHAAAAGLLHDEGAPEEVVAAHLLRGEPGGHRWAVESLAAGAAIAIERGAPELAVRLLDRALREPPAEAQRPELVLSLLEALIQVGDYGRVRELEEVAARLLDAPAHARRAAVELAGARHVVGDINGAVAVLDRAIAAAPPADRVALEAERGQIGSLAPETATQARKQLTKAAAGADEQTPSGRAVLGALAFALMLEGRDRASAVAYARRALRAGILEDDPAHAIGYQATLVLEAAERFEEARRLMDQTIAGLPVRHAHARMWAYQQRASTALRTGDLAGAEADAELALRLMSPHPPAVWPSTLAFLVEALVEQGRLGEAEALLDERLIPPALPPTGPWQWLAYSRARLRLATASPEEALADLRSLI